MVTPHLANALPEEPDALIALVRICGGLGGKPPGLPGSKVESFPSSVKADLMSNDLRQTGGCGGGEHGHQGVSDLRSLVYTQPRRDKCQNSLRRGKKSSVLGASPCRGTR